eukprot:Hpha_TRINITY_DN15292_c8_g7::TRINITY_DN15292_c8_g7_i1::g.68348::m.68348/K19751/DNAAF2, KTU, PF13; dynein assembly factor 2, axonemal
MEGLQGLPNMTTVDTTKASGDVKMTPEEQRRFRDCMQDPKFVELWKEYADEISDPKHLAEQEEYLKQVEREANEKGDYSFTFCFPKPNFCVRMKKVGKEAVYINICDSEKVDEPKEETTGDTQASNYSVPVSMGKKREDAVEGQKVIVFDAAFHPKATYLARQSDRFTDFLVDIAVDSVNGNPQLSDELSAKLVHEYTRVAEPRAIGNIPPMTLRIAAVKGKEGELVFDGPKHKPDKGPAFGEVKKGDAFADRIAAGMGDAEAKKRVQQRKKEEKEAEEAKRRAEEEEKKRKAAEAAKAEKERKLKEKENAKAFAAGLKGAFAKPEPPSPPEGPLPSGRQPQYTLIHQGEVSLQDTWEGPVDCMPTRKIPVKLVLRVELPEVKKASELDLNIDSKSVSLTCAMHDIALVVPLPHKIDEDKATAKFDKARKQLSLTLPVIPEKNEFELKLAEERREKLAKFREEARIQQVEDDRVRKEKEEKERAERRAREEEARKRREEEEERRREEDADRRELDEAMEKAVAEERERREREQREREEAEQKRREEELRVKEEQLQLKLGEVAAKMVLLEERETEARRIVEREEGRGLRKHIRDLEAARVADRMQELTRQRQREVPLTNRYIFELE